jgi:hypothetical protein
MKKTSGQWKYQMHATSINLTNNEDIREHHIPFPQTTITKTYKTWTSRALALPTEYNICGAIIKWRATF